ncbi:2OG-Fe dioxygenase family protein [Alkalihalophilus marmarensis]|uniref:2OG-Fe dioxygenase n=1 Tax=Alkalihalophilus marmarensis DSM 21297 TaxID=1188261 RepID=U6SQE8_9BACI|nr:2OG-Fe dioxygenase family protein [Alkalihalophilus marmarensis]ERN53934.1 hypothetical protein A33I_09020 [Alkalihalophilus marmarensis DSM 21297]MCM3491105.1 2OG-Fe dioxygenase family protein [Alkalihalophilus marmarensis]
MSELKKHGFTKFNLRKTLKTPSLDKDLTLITEAFEYLPEDSYAKGLNRYRRYSRAIINPANKTLDWLPNIEENGVIYSDYFQGAFNPEFIDSYRRFPSITQDIKETQLLKDIIMNDYNLTFWKKEELLMPIHVGVHFVKLLVNTEGEIAISSPNHLHQDGEPFTFAHLVSRDNVFGGVNAIATPANAGKQPSDVGSEDLIVEFTLDSPLESYGVFDAKVSHYVGEIIKGTEDRPGERSVILIDFQTTVVPEPLDEEVKEDLLMSV